MGRTKSCIFIILLTIILQLKSTIAMNPKGFTLRMIHKDSEESPFYNPLDHLMTPDERFQTLTKQSIARARYIASQINPDVYASVVYEDTCYYAAKLDVGTFPGHPGYMSYYFLVDSGADITWLQCQGATQFFHQDSDLYPWRNSTSYDPITCEDPSTGCQRCNEEGQCVYTLFYAGSQAYVVFAKEKFTVLSRTGGTESIQLTMGCGLRQANFTFGNAGRGNVIAGILGLGRGEHSFITQLGRLGEGKFSYCFEKYRGRMVGNTDLSFGADATIERQVRRTPIVRSNTWFYYLYLEGIRVGDDIVPIPRSEFQLNHDQTGGCFIDSGAPFTVMYRNIFDRVAAYVDLHLLQFGMHRAGSPDAHACYAPIPGIAYTVPTITFHFQQAAYVVSGTQTWYAMEGKICLGITRTDFNSPAVVLGALQQTDKRIFYNIGEMSLSFAEEICGSTPSG